MSVSIRPFGKTAKGQPVDLVSLVNGHGMTCNLISYGATIQSLLVPGKNGQLTDVTLGFDTIEGYESAANPFFGATVGRHANRIAGAAFELNGQLIQITANEGRNNLHSCPDGFNQVVWDYTVLEQGDEPAVEFFYHSPDGESGFPGNLDCKVTFRLTAGNAIAISYDAVADQDTVMNFTNHAYFNLAGQGSGPVLDHQLMLAADSFTPMDAESLPDGRIAAVAGTPFDFTTSKAIGRDIAADDQQLRFGLGYDHNFVLRGETGVLRLCAKAFEPVSGLAMTVETTSPAVQLYTGNFLNGVAGKGQSVYGKNGGFCLETQFYPNSFQHKHFPSPVVKAGDHFLHTTIYQFES